MKNASPKVVIVHDYVTQRGGAERVALDLLRAFPSSPLVTSFWQREGSFPEFADYDITTFGLNKLGLLRNDPRRAFPILASAFGRQMIDDADVVICSSSGWSHRIQTTAPKIVYCHNPARWLYQPQDYFPGLPAWARSRFIGMTGSLRASDAAAAHSADRYVVNSAAVASRVRDVYGLESTIVPPACGLSTDGPIEPVEGIEPGFLLTISRARGYKHTDLICEAVASMAGQRLVVVGGTQTESWPTGITGLSGLSDAQMRWLYSNAAGLVAIAHEDFGLTVVEAQSFGLPAVVLRRGGYLDSGIEGVTSIFIDDIAPDEVAGGIRTLLAHPWDREMVRRCGARFSADAFATRMRAVVDQVLSPAGAGSGEYTQTGSVPYLWQVPTRDTADMLDETHLIA